MDTAERRDAAAESKREPATQAVTVLMGAVVVLSFLFAFGNVWALGIRLGVPAHIAPLVAPAVDLSVIGLLLGTRQLALRGASAEQIRPARRLLVFCSLVTLALNVAEPLISGHYGRAAFDSVGCILLIGWAHVGPQLLQAMNETHATALPPPHSLAPAAHGGSRHLAVVATAGDTDPGEPTSVPEQRDSGEPPAADGRNRTDTLLERARAEDARHRELHQRPISAEALRKQLHIGATRSRTLVAQLRATATHAPHGGHGSAIGMDPHPAAAAARTS